MTYAFTDEDRKLRPRLTSVEIATIANTVTDSRIKRERDSTVRQTIPILSDIPASAGGGDVDFTALIDTPNDYTGDALKYVRVKADATGVEFVIPPYAQSVYLDDEVASVGGYKRWRRAIPTGAEATAVQTGKNTDGEMLLGTWITSSGYPGTEIIPPGEWNWHMYAHVDNASNESYLKLYVYKRTTGGVETELFNVTSADIDDLAVALQHFLYTQSSEIALVLTDRLVLKAYFYTTRPADVTMTLTFDGTSSHSSHVHLPIAAGGRTIPGGATTEVQFNLDGVFTGTSIFTYDNSLHKLTVDNMYVGAGAPPVLRTGQLYVENEITLGAAACVVTLGTNKYLKSTATHMYLRNVGGNLYLQMGDRTQLQITYGHINCSVGWVHNDAGADWDIREESLNKPYARGLDAALDTAYADRMWIGPNITDPGTENLTIEGALQVGIPPGATVAKAAFYQEGSAAAISVLGLHQKDVDEPFVMMIGTAASADLTRSIVDDDDVGVPTLIGWFLVEVQDDGNQISDGKYFVPLYTLAAPP